jgi:hypothetical protein
MARFTQLQVQRTFLDDLDDNCITHILRKLSPLDVFSVAGTCRRCRDIIQDGRLALVVSRRGRSSRSLYRHVYDTLQDAVDDSRPGETILLESTAGDAPHVVSNVLISWPLHIVGGGATAADTVIECGVGASAALDFRCSGKVANVTVRAARAACVRHQQGSLWVQQCALECDAKGLDHLFSAIVTSAIATGDQLNPLAAEDVKPLRQHRLTVVETAIQGGCSAIQTLGTGALQHVRCIFRELVYFWFEVDAACEPAVVKPDPDAAAASTPSAPASVVAVKEEAEAWVPPAGQAGAPLIAAAPRSAGSRVAKKRRAAALDEEEAEALLDERAHAWSQAHQFAALG